jgi:hypothetical protein
MSISITICDSKREKTRISVQDGLWYCKCTNDRLCLTLNGYNDASEKDILMWNISLSDGPWTFNNNITYTPSSKDEYILYVLYNNSKVVSLLIVRDEEYTYNTKIRYVSLGNLYIENKYAHHTVDDISDMMDDILNTSTCILFFIGNSDMYLIFNVL